MKMNMYQEIILEHYKYPKFKGQIQKPDAYAEDNNPLCGDKIGIQMHVEGNIVKEVRFSGNGCAISQASTDMLCESVVGKSVEDAAKTSKQDILNMLGIEISPARLKCALLCLKVMKMCMYNYMGKKLDHDEYP